MGKSALYLPGVPVPVPGWGGQQAAKQAPFSSLKVHISSVAHPSVRGAAEFYHYLTPFKGQGQAETERQACSISRQQ